MYLGKRFFFSTKPKYILKYNLEEIITVNFSDDFLQFYPHSPRNNFITGYNTLPDPFPVSSYSIKTRQNHILQLQICRHWNVKSLISESIPSLHLGIPQISRLSASLYFTETTFTSVIRWRNFNFMHSDDFCFNTSRVPIFAHL